MCFSATASFTSAALLFTMGVYASRAAWSSDSRYLPLALFPVAFGFQQGFEGLTWLGLASHQSELVQLGALGFLFFSHGFWLVWPALTVFSLEERPWRRALLLGIAIMGVLLSLSLYAPSLRDPQWPLVEVVEGSIAYHIHSLTPWVPGPLVRFIYMLIVLGPLWLSKQSQIRLFGHFIGASLVVTYYFFDYAFVSIWCFFAAIASFYIAYILHSGSLMETTALENRSV